MASGAQAQDIPVGAPSATDSMISVAGRSRPDFDAVPVRFGTFDIYPAAEARLGFDDNIYATGSDRVGDALGTVSVSFSARSAWSRNALSLDAGSALTRGFSQDNEDTDTYHIRAGGRLDLGTNTRFSAQSGYSRAYEPRGSVGDTSARGPRIAYNALELAAQLDHVSGRLAIEADGALESFRYRPSASPKAAQNRDYRTWNTGLRASYALAPGIATFIEGTYNRARYPDENTSLDRSSRGWSLRSGLQFGVTRLIRGRAAIGYQNQRYQDPAFPRIKGLDFGASLEWSPTRLLTATVEARRSIQRSPLVGVAGIRQSRYALRADYELRRNVILNVRADLTVSDYAGTARIQKDFSGGGGVDWLVNRNLRLSAQASAQRTRSDGGGREFDRSRVSVAARYAL